MLTYRFYRLVTFPFRLAMLKLRNKDNKFIIDEKMGRPTEDRPKGDLIWVHCNDFAESGEAVRGLLGNMPHKTLLLTYNVRSSKHRNYFPGTICQFAPIDNYIAVRNFLRFWEPSMAVYVGSELRPIQLAMLKKSGIPSFLIDGRIPDKSYRWWKLAKRLARKTVRNFTFIWAVDNTQTLRLANLGAHDVKSEELIFGPGRFREIVYKIRQKTG